MTSIYNYYQFLKMEKFFNEFVTKHKIKKVQLSSQKFALKKFLEITAFFFNSVITKLFN